MSIRFIYGTSGTGKTTYCFNDIKNRILKEKKIYIITPEQFSFTAETKLLETVKNASVINAEVLTFNRMAYRIFNEVGGAKKTVLSECGNAMLIKYLLDKNKNKLKFLGKSDKNVDVIISMFTELKKHNITCEKLHEVLEKIEDIYLQTKLNDIYIMYSEYIQFMKNKYIDQNDLLTIMADKIERSNMFDNAVIYIDEFDGFTEQEYIIIEKLIKMSKQVNITICADWLEVNKVKENDIYYQNKKTAQKIIENIGNTEIENPVFLSKKMRFKTKELLHLEENIYNSKYKKYNEVPESIELYLASNPYLEIEHLAKQIDYLVRNENYEYNQIAVITKQIDSFSATVKAVFRKFNIPVFIDEKKDIYQNYVIKYILSIFEIFSSNFKSEAVFNYLKTGLIQINENDLYLLEMYCNKWGIKGNKWYKEDWNYGNLSAEELEKMNEIRKKIVMPILSFKDEIGVQKNVKGISEAIYFHLDKGLIIQKLEEKIKYLKENGEEELANEYITGINVFIDVLDELVMVFGNEKISFEKYKELLLTGLQNKGVGIIPATQDEVSFGDIDRSRTRKVRAVFVVGLNDGVLPSNKKDEGYINDLDRENLFNLGLELAKTTLDRVYEEQFNIYKALSIAEERLNVSYSSTDALGKTIRPSILVSKIKKIFPNIVEKSEIIKKQKYVGSIEATFDELLNNLYLLSNGINIDKSWLEILEWFKTNSKWNNKLENALKGLNFTNIPENLTESNVNEIYGDIIKTSVSKLEKYRACPFSYYLKYALNLREDVVYEINPIDTGSFMHEIIEEFCNMIKNNEIDVKCMTNEQIENIVKNILNEKIKMPWNRKLCDTAKFRVLMKKLEQVIIYSIKSIVLSLKNSSFEIYENELEFKQGASFKPIEINLDNGKKVLIEGKIDRIDVAQSEGKKYVRIIDYKSSEKDIELNEVLYGIQLQLITYLDEVVTQKDFEPAGILYYKLINPIVKAVGKLDSKQIEEEIKKQFKMKGIVLADVNIVKMMDNTLEKGKSNIVPASINREGNISITKTSIQTEDFKVLQKRVKQIVKEISNEMLKGSIKLQPYYGKNNRKPCDFCSYKTICNFNTKFKGNCYNYIKYDKTEEVLNKLKEEGI